MTITNYDQKPRGDLVFHCEGSQFGETAFAFAKQEDELGYLCEVGLKLEEVSIRLREDG